MRHKPFPASWKLIVQFLGYDPIPSTETLTDRLKAKRRELGLSKEQLAKQLGWGTGRVRRYERGEGMQRGNGLEQLEAFLDSIPFEGNLWKGFGQDMPDPSLSALDPRRTLLTEASAFRHWQMVMHP